MNIDKTIKELRERAGMTQQEVAEQLGLARATYAAMELGREPKLREILGLAKLYQIAPGDIIGNNLDQIEASEESSFEFEPSTGQPRDPDPKLKPEKLRDVLLYLTEKIGAKPNVGETVLYKLLYFIDFDYYEKTGQSITGMTYIKNHFGPTPPLPLFADFIAKMVEVGDMEVVKTKYFSHDQKKYLPLRKSSLASLNAQELEHINWEIDRLGEKSATELSEFSHYDTPWVTAKMGEPIGYRFVFYRGINHAVTEPEDDL